MTQQANLSVYLHTNPCNAEPQRSSEYQLLNSFGSTRGGNRTQLYRLRGGRSYHYKPRADYCILKYTKLVHYSVSHGHSHGGPEGGNCSPKFILPPKQFYLVVTSEFLLQFRPIIGIKTTINWAN